MADSQETETMQDEVEVSKSKMDRLLYLGELLDRTEKVMLMVRDHLANDSDPEPEEKYPRLNFTIGYSYEEGEFDRRWMMHGLVVDSMLETVNITGPNYTSVSIPYTVLKVGFNSLLNDLKAHMHTAIQGRDARSQIEPNDNSSLADEEQEVSILDLAEEHGELANNNTVYVGLEEPNSPV